MRVHFALRIGTFVVALGLNASNAARAQTPLFSDLSKVQGMEHYSGPESGRDLLSKNGFVVTQEFQRHIFLPYLNENLPHFVTADSVHRTFHVLLEDHLKLVEANAAGEVSIMLTALRAALEAQSPDAVASGTLAPLAAEARTLALDYLRVAEVLLTSETTPPDLPEAVATEVSAILNAGGVDHSALFDDLLDYSQYKPRGFYTESPELQRYFRVMSWFGNSAFLLGSDVQTLAALMLSKAFQDTPEALEPWRKLDKLYTRFLGPCDDLTPEEYGAELPELGTLDSPVALEAAIARLRAELRDPRINSMLVPWQEWEAWAAQTKGMRFMGKRYLPDSEIFLALVEPEVEGREFPSGLDLMAANGSGRAAALMAATPEGSQTDYIAASAKSREVVKNYKRDSDTHYAAILRLAETLTAPPVEQAAPFARTAAYADKNLMTSLAAWASTRHTWALHAKQPSGMLGGGPGDPEDPPPGYVEPNPAFFAQMVELVSQTRTLFEEEGLTELRQFKQFESVVTRLAEMVRKELAGEPMTEEERYLLANYGKVLKEFHGLQGGAVRDAESSWMSLVMDVHTHLDSGKCLEVATGGAMPIYVVLEHGGKPHLLIGGVYSYYEFLQPITARLSDEEWRGQWDEGRVPELPPWSGSFVAGGHDVETVIARLKSGEMVSGLEFIQDPALDAYLIENVRPDSPSLKHDNAVYLFDAASRRAPDAVNPILIEMIRNGELRPAGDASTRSFSMEVAAAAIRDNVREEDLPELVNIMATTDAVRAELISFSLFNVQSKSLEPLLAKAIALCSDPAVKSKLIDVLYMKASVDVTPVLLEIARAERGGVKFKSLLRMLQIWDCHKRDACGSLRIASTANASDLALWEAELEDAFADELAAFDWTAYANEQDPLRQRLKALREESESKNKRMGLDYHTLEAEIRWAHYQSRMLKHAADSIREIRMERAVPFLEEALQHCDRETTASVLDALAAIGTDEAADTLAKSVESKQFDDVVKRAFRAYLYDREAPDSASRGRVLIRLLENTSAFGSGGLRVCDMVLANLVNEGIPGHPGRPVSINLTDRDAKLAEWFVYLKNRPIPSDYGEDEEDFRGLGAPRALSPPGTRRVSHDEEDQ